MSTIDAKALSLADQFVTVRRFTDQIVEPLTPEDCMVQSMPDTSPIRWHLAHTTWFFETFILETRPGYRVYDKQFSYLFNSYYNRVSDQFPRPQRGLISRPGLSEIGQYRRYVDEQMLEFLNSGEFKSDLNYALAVGLNHEQQHQELMLTDIKHVLSCNPTLPVYRSAETAPFEKPIEEWFGFSEGVYRAGHEGDGFSFDNELPRHEIFLQDFELAAHPVTNGQLLEFIEDGGYERPDHWLSLGWDTVRNHRWSAPLYWVKQDGLWHQFTLSGLQPINHAWPACHISYFEADAFARWSGNRLPSEFEWELASTESDGDQFADLLMNCGFAIHPTGGAAANNTPTQMFGGVWEWTRSSYSAYPGYTAPDGALGEYNGKFMCNQYVLRGGSASTSSDHIRSTYRNFFPPDARWQFSGFRLAR